MEAVGLQALQRGVGTIRFGFQLAVEPEFVGGRNRADGGLGVAVEDHAAQIVAVDGLRNRAPEIGGAEPGALVFGNGSARHLVEPHEIGIERGRRHRARAGVNWRPGGRSNRCRVLIRSSSPRLKRSIRRRDSAECRAGWNRDRASGVPGNLFSSSWGCGAGARSIPLCIRRP
jgi:hypothetical protein